MPRNYEWLTLSRWAKEYGDIVYLEAFGQPLILLNSYKVAKDLLEKAVYADRPHLEMARLSGFDKTFVLQRYNEDWRRQRKIASQDLAPRMVPRYHTFLESEARFLARDLLQDPSRLAHLISLKAGTILIRISYGHYVSTDDDPFLTLIRASMSVFTRSAAAGVFSVLLDVRVNSNIVTVKYLPPWLPGTKFLAKAKGWRDIVRKAVWAPYAKSKHSLESGGALLPNTCATALAAIGDGLSPDLEEQLVWAAGTMTAGGLETLIIGMLNLILALILNPAVQAKAQAEIDTVIGRDRLPTISDQVSLPYVRSVVVEVFRLNPPIPLGVFHALSQDDIYQGMHIPKGSIVMANIWYDEGPACEHERTLRESVLRHMLHDPEVFTDPMEFRPERYQNLDFEMEKVTSAVFGFGRRSCPGKSLAESTLFAFAATVLATCEIVPKVDKEENDMMPNVTYSSGIFR
ncbi:putative monooxygenase [Mycena sanguinolenta]|uniref:Putative monooxygenase n=1 Tax=Mycena sanguinolenta TaxID=230812 RepID=A0A8H6ZGE8_9AGAR|nr:putative monooxygenase [Mycena sanguinolenta]